MKVVALARLLGKLRDAGLLASEKGHAGGWRLAKSPDQITLADVYIALDESLIANSGEEEVPDCSVEHVLRRKVASVMDDIERTLVQQLAKTTIGEIRE